MFFKEICLVFKFIHSRNTAGVYEEVPQSLPALPREEAIDDGVDVGLVVARPVPTVILNQPQVL